jgi:hypothetical protein
MALYSQTPLPHNIAVGVERINKNQLFHAVKVAHIQDLIDSITFRVQHQNRSRGVRDQSGTKTANFDCPVGL